MPSKRTNKDGSSDDDMYSTVSIFDALEISQALEPASLRLPNLPEEYLCVTFLEDECLSQEIPVLLQPRTVFADSEIVEVNIISAERLTAVDDAVKNVLDLTLQFQDNKVAYKPGDTFGFFCPNTAEEVSSLLNCLNLSHCCDTICKIELLPDKMFTKKIPVHLPMLSTIRQLLTHYVDIRATPKKMLLRVMVEYATHHDDRIALEYLASHEGIEFFNKCVRERSLSVLDVLAAFGSCVPPISRLLELLPPLKPRFYSVSSSPLVSDSLFHVTFNVKELEQEEGQWMAKQGVCTGWLNRLTGPIQTHNHCSIFEITSSLSDISLNKDTQTNGDVTTSMQTHSQTSVSSTLSDTNSNSKVFSLPSIHVYKRINKHFHFPDDIETPVVMIGPGTGIAPFVGFLQHKEMQMKECNDSKSFGESWLFFGCRYKDKDFLYRKELERLKASGVLSHLVTCFSRELPVEESEPRYVSDNIKQHAKELIPLIENGAQIFICGDAKYMVHDVWNAFIEAYISVKNASETAARNFFYDLDRKRQYLVDVWT